MTRRDVLAWRRRPPAWASPARARRAGRGPAPALPDATPKHLPRWRGFNLLNKFMADEQKPFEERDFADIAELGFDFVRLPLDYRCWTDPAKPTTLKEPVLKEIDQAVEFGRKHGIHVQINFHRAPGFTVARPARAEVALDRPGDPGRLRPPLGEPSRRGTTACRTTAVSFNLFNEPDDKVKPEDHRRVVERVAGAIRDRDPKRLIVCDGRAWATRPPDELIGLNVAAALHDYNPMPLTHYKASWVNWDESWPEPIWPLQEERRQVRHPRARSPAS